MHLQSANSHFLLLIANTATVFDSLLDAKLRNYGAAVFRSAAGGTDLSYATKEPFC